MRAGVAVLAAGGVALLAAGLGLMVLLRDAPARATTAGGTAKPREDDAARPAATGESRPAPGAPAPAAAPHRQVAQPSVPSGPTPLASADDEEPAPETGSDGRPIPIVDAPELREQVARMDPLVLACAKGKPITGKALLQFEVRPRKGKVIVETMGYNDEQTDLQDKDVLDCIEKTTDLLGDKFKYVRGTGAIFVRRAIEFDKGRLQKNWVTYYTHLKR
ncbi:MAG: hypothetical protein KF773_40925 [Deltaproteobacteria bacterium]|nr:hypothetical protein [Deltaproteobacteria bacterium]